MGTYELIQRFLTQKRFAVVGVSRNPDEFSHQLFLALRERGYDVVPVNPKTTAIGMYRSYATVGLIKPRIKYALLLVPNYLTGWVVRTCAQAEVQYVWMHRGSGDGAVNLQAVEYCRQHDIQVIQGFCPYMFLNDTALIHRMHGLAMKMEGKYPTPEPLPFPKRGSNRA